MRIIPGWAQLRNNSSHATDAYTFASTFGRRRPMARRRRAAAIEVEALRPVVRWRTCPPERTAAPRAPRTMRCGRVRRGRGRRRISHEQKAHKLGDRARGAPRWRIRADLHKLPAGRHAESRSRHDRRVQISAVGPIGGTSAERIASLRPTLRLGTQAPRARPAPNHASSRKPASSAKPAPDSCCVT